MVKKNKRVQKYFQKRKRTIQENIENKKLVKKKSFFYGWGGVGISTMVSKAGVHDLCLEYLSVSS